MVRIDPTSFCDCFLKELTSCTRNDWKSAPAWTSKATAAAVAACTTNGLVVSKEYLRLDVMGYDGADDDFNWRLRVAFEHEQKPGCWVDELCKLAHVVADLRVLTFYHRFDGADPVRALQDLLQKRVKRLENLIKRVIDSDWLFVIGPYRPSDQQFIAFTLDRELNVVPLVLSTSLRPCDLRCDELPSASPIPG